MGTTATHLSHTHQSARQAPVWTSRIIEYLLENFGEDLDLDLLAGVAELSKFTFCRQFHKHYGLPPVKWIWRFRAVLAAEILKLPLLWKISDVCYLVGYSSPAHFCRTFKDVYGISPKKFRQVSEKDQDTIDYTSIAESLYDKNRPILQNAIAAVCKISSPTP